MTSFSQLVDTVIQQTQRPNLKSRIIAIVANVIYELHSTADKGVIFYAANRKEELLNITVDQVLTWDAPINLQRVEAARYDLVLDYRNHPVYAKEVKPGRRMNDEPFYFYRNAGGFTFVNCGSVGWTISLAYFQRLTPLVYYEVVDRPATWDPVTLTWSYLTAVTDQQKVDAEALVTHWMLQDHDAVILEGALATLWKEAGDARSIASFSRYSTLRQALETQESVEI